MSFDSVPCPVCKVTVSGQTARELGEAEVAHMNANHPELIAQRLEAAGFRRVNDRWVDTRADPDG